MDGDDELDVIARALLDSDDDDDEPPPPAVAPPPPPARGNAHTEDDDDELPPARGNHAHEEEEEEEPPPPPVAPPPEHTEEEEDDESPPPPPPPAPPSGGKAPIEVEEGEEDDDDEPPPPPAARPPPAPRDDGIRWLSSVETYTDVDSGDEEATDETRPPRGPPAEEAAGGTWPDDRAGPLGQSDDERAAAATSLRDCLAAPEQDAESQYSAMLTFWRHFFDDLEPLPPCSEYERDRDITFMRNNLNLFLNIGLDKFEILKPSRNKPRKQKAPQHAPPAHGDGASSSRSAQLRENQRARTAYCRANERQRECAEKVRALRQRLVETTKKIAPGRRGSRRHQEAVARVHEALARSETVLQEATRALQEATVAMQTTGGFVSDQLERTRSSAKNKLCDAAGAASAAAPPLLLVQDDDDEADDEADDDDEQGASPPWVRRAVEDDGDAAALFAARGRGKTMRPVPDKVLQQTDVPWFEYLAPSPTGPLKHPDNDDVSLTLDMLPPDLYAPGTLVDAYTKARFTGYGDDNVTPRYKRAPPGTPHRPSAHAASPKSPSPPPPKTAKQ